MSYRNHFEVIWRSVIMQSKWCKWLTEESKEVQEEILRGNPITQKFKDFGDFGITLEELEQLDDKYNLLV